MSEEKTYAPRSANTFEKYSNLSRRERERRVWWWPTGWYMPPYSMIFDFGKGESNWCKVSRFLRKEYPIQYVLREGADWIYYYLHARGYTLRQFYRNWIRGHRREMRKATFPRHYRDLDSIIETFHLQCLIEFVDREQALEQHDYTHDEASKTFAAELKECYQYAKEGRAALEKKIEEETVLAYRAHEAGGGIDSYKKVNALESELYDYDTKVCEWVIKNRNRLWT